MDLHLILVRFSLDTKRGFGCHTKELYSRSRMDERFSLFENVCLPSILNQSTLKGRSGGVAKCVILVSPNMPREYKNRLDSMLKGHANIDLLTTLPNDDFSLTSHFVKVIPKQCSRIATTILDDDDALHPLFSEKVLEHAERCKKSTFVSFPKGIMVDFRTRTLKRCDDKMIAAGLTLITNRFAKHNIFGKEFYRESHVKYDYTLDTAYVMTNHDSNVSLRGKWMKMRDGEDLCTNKVQTLF